MSMRLKVQSVRTIIGGRFSTRAAPRTMSDLQYEPDRYQELKENVSSVYQEMRSARPDCKTRLVAVSKIKPASDIKALYDAGHRHFGENYIQELIDKAAVLPDDIKWHFIGTLQSNKSKAAASIKNLYVLETLSSAKVADLLQKSLTGERRLGVYLQVNTSGEDSKSGLDPLNDQSDQSSPLASLALHVLQSCPNLQLMGLMTIGSWESSHDPTKPNPDFVALKNSRSELVRILKTAVKDIKEDALELSMGMSADFVQAVKEGSDSVRVGTKIFGQRPKKQ